MSNLIPIIVAAFVLTACGGGGGDSIITTGGAKNSVVVWEGTQLEENNPLAAVAPNGAEQVEGSNENQENLLPLLRTGGDDFQIEGLPQPNAKDARHMPIYHDGKHLFVGVDQGTGQIGFLPQRYREEGIEFLYGYLFDGVGGETVAAYLSEAMRSRIPWNTPPTVRVIGPAGAEDVGRVVRAVQLINAALPENAKVEVGASLPWFSLRNNVRANGRYYETGRERTNTIHVEFVSGDEYHRDSAAVAYHLDGRFAYIQFNTAVDDYSID